MTCQYAVTFEFPTRPPQTHRGTVRAGQPHTCASRAMQSAKRALKPVGWSSVVCVLQDRADDAPASTD